jgi:peptidoglycan/LPS O-acetylase OafA/YrhL
VTERPTDFPHITALNGVRGVAVAAVLVFHGGFAAASGGFLGVSTFFTLSGFLIASLLLTERAKTNDVNLKQFWGKRFRRLMPAAVVTIGAIALISWTVPSAGRNDSLAGDLWASLFYVANWRFILSGLSYNDLFAQESPVQHFWSLAVEEQFYVIFPLLAAVLMAISGRTRQLFAGVVLVVLSVSLVLPFIYEDVDRIYNGTDVRMAEILIGVVLAVIYATVSGRETIRTSQIIKYLGLLALIGSIAIWIVTEQTDSWLYHGGFAAYAVLSVFIIAAATQHSGPVPRLLAWRPLVYLGIISYGVYLYHWPIFLWFDEDSTSLEGLPLFGLRLAITFGVAWLSFHYLETPIRRGVKPGANLDRKWVPIGAAVLVLAAGVLWLSPLLEEDEPEFEFASTPTIEQGDAPEPTEEPTAPPTTEDSAADTSPTPTTEPIGREDPPVMLVMGDSLAENLFHGLDRRAAATGEPPPERDDLIFLGCSLAKAPEGSLNRWADEDRPVCRNDYDAVATALDNYDVDVMVLPMGPPDLLPRKYPNDPDFVLTDDPGFYERLEGVYLQLQGVSLHAGVSVLWVNTPCVSDERSENVGVTHQAIRSGNEMLDEIAAGSAPWVDVFDLYAEVCPDDVFDVSYDVDGIEDENAREDGLHFSDFTANALSVQIADAARALPPVPVP